MSNTINNTLTVDKGIIKLYDGTVVYIVEMQYSTDGATNWEDVFQPFDHIDPNNPTVTIPGHKYRRTRHAGDLNFQPPEYIVAEDGKSVILRINGTLLEWNYEDLSSDWTLVYDMTDAKGDKGDIPNHIWNGTKLSFENPDGTYTVAVDLKGDKGDAFTYSDFTQAQLDLLVGERGMIGKGLHIDMYGYGINSIDPANYDGQVDASGDTVLYPNGHLPGERPDCTVSTCTTCNPGVTSNTTLYMDLNTSLVYVCTNGSWVPFGNLTANNNMVALTGTPNDPRFIDDYVTTSETIEIDATNMFEVVDDSITKTKLKDGIFTDGLDEADPNVVKVDATELIGFGITTETGIDGFENFAVNTPSLIDDGLQVGVDTLIDINTDDIVSINSGISSRLPVAGESADLQHKDIFIKSADAINVDNDGVNVISDELTLTSLDSTLIKVYETDSLSLGIQAKHVHKNLVDELKGLQKSNDTVGSFEVKLDTLDAITPLEFNANGEINLADDGVQGKHLNTNGFDNARGLLLDEGVNKVFTLVDDVMVGFNGSGQIELKDSSITAAKIADDQVVKSINGLQDVVSITVDPLGTSQVDLIVSNDTGTDTLNLSAVLNINDDYILENMIATGQVVKSLNGLYDTVNIVANNSLSNGASIGVNVNGAVIEINSLLDYTEIFSNIPYDAIQNVHLNSNVVNEDKALYVNQGNNGSLEVKVDGVTVDFNGSGQLEVIGLGAIVIPDALMVTSIRQGATILRDDIEFTGSVSTTSNFITTDVNLNGSTGVVNFESILDLVKLEAQLITDGFINSALAAVAWSDLTGQPTDNTDLVTYLDDSFVPLNDILTNVKIEKLNGIVLLSPNGTEYQLIVSDNGDLDTKKI